MACESFKERFAELSTRLSGIKSLYIICHDNPDPDSLAAMFLLRHLLRKHFRIGCRLLFGGVIGRAENRAMVRRLKIPVASLEQARLREGAWYAMVDTQPASKNHSLPPDARVLIVFDHHPLRRPLRSEFTHVEPELGATSTLVLRYVREAGLELDWRLATALAYAIISETQDLGRESSREDIQAYLYTLPRTRLHVLSQIRNPDLPQSYFQTLQRALSNTYCYKNLVVTRLGRVESSDMIHQMADLFLRFERRTWSLCIGWTGENILLSLRSSSVRARCGRMIQILVRGRGSAGGHDMMAGGRIACAGMKEEEIRKVEELVITRFLRQFRNGGGPRVLTPLVRPDQDSEDAVL